MAGSPALAHPEKDRDLMQLNNRKKKHELGNLLDPSSSAEICEANWIAHGAEPFKKSHGRLTSSILTCVTSIRRQKWESFEMVL